MCLNTTKSLSGDSYSDYRGSSLGDILQAVGVTDAVVAEVDRSLTAHELIKMRIGGTDRDERTAMAEAICARVDAALVAHVGKVFVLWRPRPDEPPPAA